jgi:hypothetical protein
MQRRGEATWRRCGGWCQRGPTWKQDKDGWRPLHHAAVEGHEEVTKVLVELGAHKNAMAALGVTPLHVAAGKGHVDTVKLLAQLGAELGVRTAGGETPLQMSVRLGHHQMAQVLRELERTAARAQKAAATSARTRQPARQDTPETREAAERMAAELIEEEERVEAAAALAKVRVAPPSPHIGLHSVQLGGVRDAAFLSHG